MTTHIPGPVAGIVALFTAAIGQLVAFIPSIATYQSVLISAGTFLIAAVYLIANALHHMAANKRIVVPVNTGEQAIMPPARAVPADALRDQLRVAGIDPVA